MRILITGANGLLGQKLADKLFGRQDIELLCLSKRVNRNPALPEALFQAVDITDFDSFEKIALTFSPTHIIHSAALTSVEVCEQEKEQCKQINIDATEEIANFCKAHNIHLTFLSTDFVFDGKEGPYHEEDITNPCNNYGASKLEAEQCIIASGCRAVIIRTILVYGVIADRNRSNIVLWAKSKLSQGEHISVVADQWRMPTWVDDLADACILACKNNATGIFHISGETMMSILEIVQQVASYWNLDQSLIQPITAGEIGQADNRPRTTGFILEKAKRELGFAPTPFINTLKEIDKQLSIL